MLKITRTQLSALEAAARATFEETMVARYAELAPTLAASLGRDQMLVVIRAAVSRAARHGFTFNGPVRLFVELGFLFGSGFDADAQYPWARACLENVAVGGQMRASSALYSASMKALRRIHGPQNRHTNAALHRIVALAAEPPPLHAHDFAAVALEAMWRMHPQKCAFVGKRALLSLIAAGEADAARHGFVEPHDVLLLVALMFAFGQQCAEDPSYPWIAGTLLSTTITTPRLRARQLEKTALTWLGQVLMNLEIST